MPILAQGSAMTLRMNIVKRLSNQFKLRQRLWNLQPQRKHKVGGKCNDLASTAELLQQAQITESRNLGIQDVPLKQIVGSSRWRDFDLSFQPKRGDQDGRWQQQAEAQLRGAALSPVKLLKITGRYFVFDGNHRISVAQALDQSEIAAKVIELEVTNIQPSSNCQRLGFRLNSQNGFQTNGNC